MTMKNLLQCTQSYYLGFVDFCLNCVCSPRTNHLTGRSFATHKPHLCQFLHMLILGQLQDLKHLIYTMFENHKSSHICNPFGFVHNNFSLQFFCNSIISISRVFLCPVSSYVKYIKLQHLCSIRDAKNCVKFVKCTASLTNLTCAWRTTMFCQKIMQKTLRKSKAESTRFSTFSL